MQAINDYVIIDIIKEGPKKVGGLILTEETDEANRYKKAKIVSIGELVNVVKTVTLFIMMWLLAMILVITIIYTG